MEVFAYNKDAVYTVKPYNTKNIDFDLTIAVNETQSFEARVPNPLKNYLNPPIKSDSIAKIWLNTPMQCFQNQLNFAVFCASTACGVSFVDHMNHPNSLVRSVYRFHFYYQFRRILSELQAPLAHEASFNFFNNRINKKAFERLCSEFNIDPKTDFRQLLDLNHGMGTLYYWGSGRVYNYDYWPGHTSFQSGTAVQLGSIQQKHKDAWTTFILDKSNGFTQPGVERLNDSIRTYVWCLLGSQAQTRSNIMQSTTGFDSQKQYLANLEDAISSAIDLPNSIKRYEDTLRYARSKVDFVIGNGLYMLPSDLRLQIGTITSYNNEILVAESQNIGKNQELNSKPAPVIVRRIHHPVPQPLLTPTPTPTPIDNHESMKTALVVGLTLLGLFGLYYHTNN